MATISGEIERFNRLSETWWNKHGPMRPLHVVNTLRLDYVIAQVVRHIGRNPANALYGCEFWTWVAGVDLLQAIPMVLQAIIADDTAQ